MEQRAPFAKMNGLGNEIIVADMRGRTDRITSEAAIARDRNPATKFDQIMAVHSPRSDGTDAYVEIINSDGTYAQACGNGMRCVVQALSSQTGKREFSFETIAGILTASEHPDGQISVDMGKPRFEWQEIPISEPFHDTRKIELQIGPIDAPVLHSPSVVSMGNPHAIFWVDQDVWTYELERFGPMLENHPMFPERANISIAHVTSRNAITLRTWERGAGITRACGSAACAAGVSAARTGRTDRAVTVTVPGGPLIIEWLENDHVLMTGPAEWEFSGFLDPQNGNWARGEDAQGAA
jgi:diaminopimelate epimerase